MKALVISLLLGVSWLDCGTIAPKRKARPAPIEPDVKSNGNRDLRAPTIVEDPWKPDVNGFYWVKAANGQLFGDLNRDIVKPYGTPVNR